jgi:hypothetical protein
MCNTYPHCFLNATNFFFMFLLSDLGYCLDYISFLVCFLMLYRKLASASCDLLTFLLDYAHVSVSCVKIGKYILYNINVS